MGFRRIAEVWFFGLVSAVIFVAVAASLTGGSHDVSPGAAATSGHAVEREAETRPRDVEPMHQLQVSNVDRRGVLVPVPLAGVLLSTDAGIVLP